MQRPVRPVEITVHEKENDDSNDRQREELLLIWDTETKKLNNPVKPITKEARIEDVRIMEGNEREKRSRSPSPELEFIMFDNLNQIVKKVYDYRLSMVPERTLSVVNNVANRVGRY